MVILDGLQVASRLHAFIECGLHGLQDLVTDAVLEAGQEELMLDKFEGIHNAFSFGFLDRRSCRTYSSHGGRLVVNEMLVGHLYMVGVVVDGLIRLLCEVCEVGASSLG